MQKTQLSSKQSFRISPKRLLSALIALLVFFILLTSVIGLAEKHIAIRGRIKELKAEQKTLDEKKVLLSEMNKNLETPEGKEHALRDKYNLVKPGEEMIIVTQGNKDITFKDDRPRMVRWWDSILRGLGIKKD